MSPSKLPYGRQSIDQDDIDAVVEVLRGDWLTTGPAVDAFEQALASKVGAKHAVAVSNGTTALHAAYQAAGVGPGDEVVVPTMTFAATANAACYLGAKPVFVDSDPGTLLIDVEAVKESITKKTKLLVGVDFAGQPCDWRALREIAEDAGIRTVCDGAHALGAIDADGTQTGSGASMTTFSFHPVKHITTGEGGMVSTDDEELDGHLRRIRNHGLTSDHRQREKQGTATYDMVELGHNMRMSDIHAALGRSQLRHLDAWIERRNAIAARYDAAFQNTDVQPLAQREGVRNAYHLYVVQVAQRDQKLNNLRDQGILANIHYKPVHLHTYYQERGSTVGDCPVAEDAYTRILSLPMFPGMTDEDVDRVVAAL